MTEVESDLYLLDFSFYSLTSIPIDLADPHIIFVASLRSNAFKSFIFSFAIASACFMVIDPATTLPGSLEPLFNFAASLIKCEAGGDLIIKSNFLSL